jgi:hypothetical protein
MTAWSAKVWTSSICLSVALLVLLIIAEISLIFIERHALNAGNSTMKIRMDKTLRFWVDVAYEDVKSYHRKLTKRRLIAQILHQYQDRGDVAHRLVLGSIVATRISC